MKKILALLFFSLVFSLSLSAQEDNKIDNPGYMKSIGFAGILGMSPDYYASDYKDANLGFGAFIYFTPVNTIYGNMIIGLGSNFNRTFLTVKNSNQQYVRTNSTYIPLQLNIGYSTSSDFINVWGGAGFTLNMMDIQYRQLITADGRYYNLDRYQSTYIAGIDAFVGVEYILTKNKMLGIFAEVRYSFVEDMILNKYIPEADTTIRGKVSPFVMRYQVGLTLHF